MKRLFEQTDDHGDYPGNELTESQIKDVDNSLSYKEIAQSFESLLQTEASA